MDDHPLSGLNRDPTRASSEDSAKRSDKDEKIFSSDGDSRSPDPTRRRPRIWSEVRHGEVGFPAAEGGSIPKVQEIILTHAFLQDDRVQCIYGEMWGRESNAVVVGYVDSILGPEDNKNMAVEREDFRRPCPSAVMINYRPLVALLGQIMGIDKMPTPCLMVYPFKSLVNFHDEIEAEVRRLNNNLKEDTKVSRVSTDATETTTESQSTEEQTPEQADSTAFIDSLKCFLTDFMHNYLHSLLDIRNKIASVSLDAIAFTDLWQLYRPGTTVIENGNPMNRHKQQAYRIFYVEAPSPLSHFPSRIPHDVVTIHCYSLAYDGATFRPGKRLFHVSPYHGLKKIRHLSVLPIKYATELESELQTRGRNFLVHRYGHRRYAGRTENMYGIPEEYVDEEVFVDFEMGRQYCPPFGDQLASQYSNEFFWFSCDQTSRRSRLDDDCQRCQGQLFRDDVQDRLLCDQFCHGFRPPTWTNGQPPDESDEGQEILLPPWLIAMRLSSQQLCVLSIGLITHTEPSPSRSILRNLVLPEGVKATLTAVVNYCESKDTVSPSETVIADITNSYQGLVVLLHGPPGSGKSSAVKAIAQSAHPPRPVYHLKGGVLPSEPDNFANCLKKDLKLANRWGCAILFDDAEIYLSERADNMNKSRLLCIFLSMLDDFKGLLFLTTNRVGLIDEALKTRIHVALAFPRLSERATEMIWRDQIEKARRRYHPPIRMKGIKDLVREQRFRSASERSYPWNARQIQNAFHVSLVLAVEDSRIKAGKDTSSSDEPVAGDEAPSDKIELKPHHLTEVFKLRDAFESYMTKCRGNDEERAYEFSIRADNFEGDLSGRSDFVPDQTGRHSYARHDPHAPYTPYAPQHTPHAAYTPSQGWIGPSRTETNPAVDFIDANLPKIHPAFTNPPAVYDEKSAQFVPVRTSGTEMGPSQATHTPQARLNSPPLGKPRRPLTNQSSNIDYSKEKGDGSDVDWSMFRSFKESSH